MMNLLHHHCSRVPGQTMVLVTLLLVSDAIGKSNTYERLDSKTKLKEVTSWDEEEDWFAPRKIGSGLKPRKK